MTTLVEGSLRISFPADARVSKFDNNPTHGLSHCMKAVDFIVEEEERILYIEFKDPDDPRARTENREEFISKFRAGALDDDLKYKCRDTFLYQWAAKRVDKPIHYLILIAIAELSEADIVVRTDDFKRRLPLHGPSTVWKQPFVAACMMFNIQTWNRLLPQFPVERVL